MARRAVLYVLPKSRYFAEGRRGRVAHAIGVARGLSDAGHDVEVLSGEGLAGYRADFGSNVVLHEVPAARSSLAWTRRACQTIERLLGRDDRIGFVVIRYASSNGFMFPALARRHADRVWVFEVNSVLYHQLERAPMWLRRATLTAEAALLCRVDGLYVVSEGLKADLRQARRLRSAPIISVPNGGSPALAAIALSGSAQGVPQTLAGASFGYLGVFQSYYELDCVLRAFAIVRDRLPNSSLHLFGDGPQLPDLQRMADRQSGVVFRGRYDLARLASDGALPRDMVLLLPYKDVPIARIGSPTKLFEYMALGRPIIASRVGQLTDVLAHGETALLYRPGDAADLAACMDRLAREPSLREALGAAALRAFLTGHTWTVRMQALHAWLVSLPSGRHWGAR